MGQMLALGSLMTASVWIVAVVVLIAVAFWPARVAGRKGHSFILFFRMAHAENLLPRYGPGRSALRRSGATSFAP
jgi:hypothetical protein